VINGLTFSCYLKPLIISPDRADLVFRKSRLYCTWVLWITQILYACVVTWYLYKLNCSSCVCNFYDCTYVVQIPVAILQLEVQYSVKPQIVQVWRGASLYSLVRNVRLQQYNMNKALNSFIDGIYNIYKIREFCLWCRTWRQQLRSQRALQLLLFITHKGSNTISSIIVAKHWR
jgi:hypothetical protein